MIIKIPYNDDYTNAHPMKGALTLSSILKEEYGLVREKDYTWHFATREKNLVISLTEEHASLSSVLVLRFMGVNLYEI